MYRFEGMLIYWAELWPNDERLIISVGTGSAPGPDLTRNLEDLAEVLRRIVTDSESEQTRFRRRNEKMVDEGRLFRFNVSQGLDTVGIEEYKATEEVEAHTSTYLRMPDTAREIRRCAASMKQTGQRLGYIGGEG